MVFTQLPKPSIINIHTHRARVWGGQSKYVTVGLAANHHYTIARGDTPTDFDIKLSDLHAPISKDNMWYVNHTY